RIVSRGLVLRRRIWLRGWRVGFLTRRRDRHRHRLSGQHLNGRRRRLRLRRSQSLRRGLLRYRDTLRPGRGVALRGARKRCCSDAEGGEQNEGERTHLISFLPPGPGVLKIYYKAWLWQRAPHST